MQVFQRFWWMIISELRGWSLCEIIDQAGAGFYKAGQQQRLLFPELKQDKMTISKKYAPPTVISLAPICRSTTSTLFSEHFFRQSHTARDRQIKRKDCPIGLLGTSWPLQEQYASLNFHAIIGRHGSVVVRQICIPGLSCTGGTPWFFFVYGGITSCGSASLKLCICKAASP